MSWQFTESKEAEGQETIGAIEERQSFWGSPLKYP